MMVVQASIWRRNARCSGVCWLHCCQSIALGERQASGCRHETYGSGKLLCQTCKVSGLHVTCSWHCQRHTAAIGALKLDVFHSTPCEIVLATLWHVLRVICKPRLCLTIKAE